eukprot:TRINITY_DN1439_c0_g5_i1.p1 TRINITY_DN1439_c0_g5~~TRINITY_DN1439_c0_g5_i1.p1  ORF type:complete len:424 (-),score=93.99 TRINITY_DN1439_c0_g5_i1:59-1330(-)
MSANNSTVHIGNFFREFKSFAASIERSSKDLKNYLENPPLSIQDGGTSTNNIVDDMCEKVIALDEQVTRLNNYPGLSKGSMDSLSFENIIESIMAVYKTNEDMKENVVGKLEQYGYKRRQKGLVKPSINHANNNHTHNTNAQNTHAHNTNYAVIDNFPHDKENIHASNSITSAIVSKESNSNNYPSIPHTPVTKKSNDLDDLLRTPTLEDFGISATTRELISKDDAKLVKRKVQVSPPLKMEDQESSKTQEAKKTSVIAPTSSHNELIPPTATANEHSPRNDRMENVDVNPRRERKKKKASSSSLSTLFPLINLVTDEESKLIPDYVRHTMPVELLNRCISFINERITDRRFGTVEESRNSMDENSTIGENQISEAQIREYLDQIKLGSKTKTLVLTLTKLKKITTEIRDGMNIYTILDSVSS